VEALQVHKRTGVSLGTVLVNLGYITDDDLYERPGRTDPA